MQQFADQVIENELKACNANNKHFNKMFLTLMDPQTGEIIVMSGKTINKETGEVSDYAAGNYLDANLIGSTIKGGSLYVGFKNNLITPNTYFMDEPIKIKNTAEKNHGNHLEILMKLMQLLIHQTFTCLELLCY
ncbi:penicillin-binding transpeptidase domain-containing protein [Coprobacillaceae bacterium CR2/5/TPMF4]|nr:penicillin-binding transpeptidase domain-containing protein [Coprobacillaceae bacterium CR2/5/TPMF4]